MKFLNVIFVLLVLATDISAQNDTLSCPCCTDEYNQFNFWEGDWMVFDTLDNAVGSNSIIRMQGNCLLQENWHTEGSTGTSYNYYDRSDKLWHQIWVDSNGGTLNLSGILVGNDMVLRSKVVSGKNGNFYHRITWSPQENGDVIQHWEMVNEENKAFKSLFKGIYKKNL